MEPIYLKIKNLLKEQIDNGELKEGDKLPSEHELCKIYGISRITAMRALNELAVENYVKRERGSGTTVLKKELKATSNLVSLVMKTEGHTNEPLAMHLSRELNKHNLYSVYVDPESLETESGWNDLLNLGTIATVIASNRKLLPMLENYWTQLPFTIYLNEQGRSRYYPGGYVISDTCLGAAKSAKLAIERGYDKIAFHTYLRKGEGNELYIEGIRDVCLERNIPFEVFDIYEASDDEIEFERIAKMLQYCEENTAILTDSDHRAGMICKVAKQSGWNIPEEIGIFGYFNTPWAEAYDLTTVSIREAEIAAKAAELAASRIERKIVIEPEIIERNTIRKLKD
jgi:DNA-binding LacI/PurR family transcriptional regulator